MQLPVLSLLISTCDGQLTLRLNPIPFVDTILNHMWMHDICNPIKWLRVNSWTLKRTSLHLHTRFCCLQLPSRCPIALSMSNKKTVAPFCMDSEWLHYNWYTHQKALCLNLYHQHKEQHFHTGNTCPFGVTFSISKIFCVTMEGSSYTLLDLTLQTL